MNSVLSQTVGISKLLTIETNHCNDSYGCLLVNNEGKKEVMYSSDTKPCKNVIRYAKYAKVLIHEATLDDHIIQQDKNLKKQHSTQQ